MSWVGQTHSRIRCRDKCVETHEWFLHTWATCLKLSFRFPALVCVWCSVVQSCLTLCDPMNRSLPDSFVHGIFQANILEWVAMPSSSRSSWPRDAIPVSCTGRQSLYHWTKREAWCEEDHTVKETPFFQGEKGWNSRWCFQEWRSSVREPRVVLSNFFSQERRKNAP